MKKKISAPKTITVDYDKDNISPSLLIDLGNAAKYRSAIKQIRAALYEDRSSGKLLALQVSNSLISDSIITFFMHRQDAYIVGFINNHGINEFPDDDELRYPNEQIKFLLSNLKLTVEQPIC